MVVVHSRPPWNRTSPRSRTMSGRPQSERLCQLVCRIQSNRCPCGESRFPKSRHGCPVNRGTPNSFPGIGETFEMFTVTFLSDLQLEAKPLEPFRPYLEEGLQAGVWNARVLLREFRERNYDGCYTLLTDWRRPQRQQAESLALQCSTRAAQSPWAVFR